MADFLLAATYWPRSKGLLWWQHHDRGEVREALDQAVALGLGAVRLHLLWEEFQPRLDRVGSQAMSVLEQTLDDANERGLQVMATLLAGAVSGALCYPAWATTGSPAVDVARMASRKRPPPARRQPDPVQAAQQEPPLVYEQGYRTTSLRDLYGDPVLLDAQRYLVREVVGYFASHEALWAWQLGLQPELARWPEPGAYSEYQRRLLDEARQAGGRRLLAGAGLRGLAGRGGLELAELAELADGLVVSADPPPGLRLPQLPALEEALLALGYSQALAPGTAVLLDEVGMASAPAAEAGWVADTAYGREQPVFLADEERQAAVLAERLRQLYTGGAAGVVLAALGDYDPQLWSLPPLARSRRGRTQGLLRSDGSEKPAALAVRDFVSARQAGTLGAAGARPLSLPVDPQEQRRQPGPQMQRLLRELVQEQREQ